MVYCGRPSRGCQMCRTRRIKCDETKPTCIQCQKSRRPCPGYRDDFDLVFRNETQATERRARKSIYAKKITLQVTQKAQLRIDTASSTAGNQPTAPLADCTSLASSPTIPVEQLVSHYFLSNFVLLPGIEGRRGFLDFLLPLLRNEPPDSHLSVSFKAVALAAFGNRPNSKKLLVQASSEYSRALSSTNIALANPVMQKSDHTLAAVLLLGLFETITLRRTNLASWGTHIDGAVALVKMRGKKQLRTKIGCSLFFAVRAQMLINCLSASKSPEMGLDWWLTDSVKDSTLAIAIRLNFLVTELRADTNRAMTLTPRTPENFSKIFELLRRAQELEEGYLDWIENLTDAWLYKTVAWVDAIPDSDLSNSEVYPGRVDMYSDLNTALMWNGVRVARLFLAGIAIRCAAWIVSPIDYRTTPEYASASRLGTEMVNDMIASIPFHLGWSDGQGTYDFKTGGISAFVCGEDYSPVGKVVGAHFISWPLFTINCSDFTTDAQRRWVIGRLKYMGEIMGLSQASVLSHFQLRLPSMIVKRDGMGLAAPDAKILGSNLGKLPTAGYPTNPLTEIPIPPPLSASATNSKSSLFYSPVTMNHSFSNVSTIVQSMATANPAYNSKDNIAQGQPHETANLTFISSNIGAVKLPGSTGPANHAFDKTIVDPTERIGMTNTPIRNTTVSTAPPLRAVQTMKPSFNDGVNPAAFSTSRDNFCSDIEDEIQVTEAAEREAKRRAEEIAFACTFGDAIRSTTGDEVGISLQSALPLNITSPTDSGLG